MELLIYIIIIVVVVAVIVWLADQLPPPIGMVVKYGAIAIAVIAMLFLLIRLFRGAGVEVPAL